MHNLSERETAPDLAMKKTKAAVSSTVRSAMPRSDRDSVHLVARLRKRAESRVEHELDAFWDNVPI